MRKRNPLTFQSSSEEEASINITPLIDVVFVLLIMFIIIAPMLELDRVALAPSANREETYIKNVQENSPIVIYVHADNSIWLGKRKVDAKQLPSLLKEMKKQYPNRTPQLFHDKKAYFETYQMVKNALETAGFETLDVILQPG